MIKVFPFTNFQIFVKVFLKVSIFLSFSLLFKVLLITVEHLGLQEKLKFKKLTGSLSEREQSIYIFP